MAGNDRSTTVGVCVVRAETDPSAGLIITVTVRSDIDDSAGESVLYTAATGAALARVAEFLASVAHGPVTGPR